MYPKDIVTHLRKRPYEPIRVYVTDGTHYDVPHPDLMIVSMTEVIIGVGATNGDLPAHFVYIDPLHITRIEPAARRGKSKSRKSRR